MNHPQTVKVNVLLSTYNGERFLREQIDSIFAQKDVEVLLTVRDDGSKDSTLSILQGYGSQLSWYQGNNLGPARSFMELLQRSEDADLYAFADQDDFWLADKLSVAANCLKEYADVPALYFSRTQLTDENLQPTGVVETNPLLTFGESLVYEFVPGCTIVMNRRLRDIVNRYTPDYLSMHDVWVYSVALAVGAKVVFDKTPHILYRQHGNNTIGQGYSQWHEWKRRWKRLSSNEQSRYRRAAELERGFTTMMDERNRLLLARFIRAKQSIVQRVRLMNDKRYLCSDTGTWKRFQLALLLNTY